MKQPMFGNKSLIRKEINNRSLTEVRKEINNRSLTEIEIITEQVRLRGLASEVTGKRVAMKTPEQYVSAINHHLGFL